MGAFEWSQPLPELPPAKSYLDPDGDLCIQVGESPATSFIVCSRTLARSSSYWNKLLNGDFKESRKHIPQDSSLEWTIRFPEDHPRPMALLLNIIHGRFDQVPSHDSIINIRYLYEISVLTDKYDMTHVLRPWARGWLRSMLYLNAATRLSLRDNYHHERLWISWELGDKVSFEKITSILLLNSSAITEDANSLRCNGILEPPDIYKIIERTRLDTIRALLASVNNIIQGLIQKDKKLCQMYAQRSEEEKARAGQPSCLASMLGASIQSLHHIGLYPLPQPVDVQWSVSDLSAKLKTIEIKGICGVFLTCSQEQALHAEVEKILNSIPPLLTEVHHRHLDSRAKKSGVTNNLFG